MAKFWNKDIQQFFEKEEFVERSVLFSFFQQFEQELNENTFAWRIHDLKSKGLIKEVKRGVYTRVIKNDFAPNLPEKLIKLSKIVAKDFDDLEYCMISTEWLNFFTHHQLGKFYYILEVEKYFVESVFNEYSEIKGLRVLIEPDEKVMTRYLEYDNTIIIKGLISRSPIQKITYRKDSKNTLHVPTIEKLLVDAFCDQVVYFPVQGKELDRIYEKAIRLYNLNFTKLLSYARRRAKEAELKNYLTDNFNDLIGDIF